MTSSKRFVQNRNNLEATKRDKVIATYDKLRIKGMFHIDKERLDLRDLIKQLHHCESDYSPLAVKYLGKDALAGDRTIRRRFTAPPCLQKSDGSGETLPPPRRCATGQTAMFLARSAPVKLSGDFTSFYLSRQKSHGNDLVIHKSLLSVRRSFVGRNVEDNDVDDKRHKVVSKTSKKLEFVTDDAIDHRNDSGRGENRDCSGAMTVPLGKKHTINPKGTNSASNLLTSALKIRMQRSLPLPLRIDNFFFKIKPLLRKNDEIHEDCDGYDLPPCTVH